VFSLPELMMSPLTQPALCMTPTLVCLHCSCPLPPSPFSQVRDAELRAQLVSRCMIKSYQPQSGSEPAMGLLVPRTAAAAAAAGGPLTDGCSAEELEGDYSWDCEYSFDLLVSNNM
jgi:hypothetical protein